MKGFGERLGAWRRARHMTQAELATAIGVKTNTVGSYEIDHREPPFDTLIKIADVLNVPIDRLLKGQPLSSEEIVETQRHTLVDNEKHFLITLLKDAGYTVMYNTESMLVSTPPLPIVAGNRDFNATDCFPVDELRARVVSLLHNAALPFVESYARQFLAIVDKAKAAAFGIEIETHSPIDKTQ